MSLIEKTTHRGRGRGKALAWIMAHVDYDGDGCLPWPFATDTHGYGMFGANGEHHKAHLFMCQQMHGPRPSPKHQASHSCGQGHKACVHPKHVSWKTRSENHLDRRRHGTAATNKWGKNGKMTVEEG